MRRRESYGRKQTGQGRGRFAGLALLALLGLAACAGDPRDIGLTGPYPEGVAPVTLTRPLPRSETADDTPGIKVDTLDRYATMSMNRVGTGGGSGNAAPQRRYYGYDH